MEEVQDEAAAALRQRQETLMDLDTTLGPLRIGEAAVSRMELERMGACIADAPVSVERYRTGEADQALMDQLRFSAVHLKGYLASASSGACDQVSAALFEVASLRSEWAPALLTPPDTSDASLAKLDRLLKRVQAVNLNEVNATQSLPGWADKVRSGSVQSLGAGLQLYGFYSAIRGIGEAIRSGDAGELLFEAGAFSAEVLSLGVELALEGIGKKIMSAGHSVYRGFCASRVGLLLRRGAGLMASALTVPFDIAQAVLAFSKALKAQGKLAQDLYVEAGFSLLSATLSVVLGVSALAGFSAAGPAGFIAAAVLIVGTRIYAACRVVDDIDDYIELSTLERLRTGWFAFTGAKLDEGVLDRYTTSRARSAHAQRLNTQANNLLGGELKDSVQAVVNGKFDVRLQTIRHWKHQWDEASGEAAFTLVREPVIHDLDDYFDTRKEGAVDRLPEATWGTRGPEKGVLWLLGGGTDTVMGMSARPNHFRFGDGLKYLVGGSQDDEFVFEVSAAMFSGAGARGPASTLIGGAGADTLSFSGEHKGASAEGLKVNLGAGTVELITDNAHNGLKCMGLWGIENVSSLPGASSEITGSHDVNRIILKGAQDKVDAMAGDDQLLIASASARVNGGPGADYFEISDSARDVVIEEDGQQQSLIMFNWPMSHIQQWSIVDNDLTVTSTSGRDGELPGPSVVIENVYALRDGRRHVVNALFSFLTQDGYRIIPLLPEELEPAGQQPVSMQVVAPPGPPVSPVVLGAGQSVSLRAGRYDYFVSRGHAMTVIDAGRCEQGTQCRVYVDYDSHELSGVHTTYHVDTHRQSNFDYLSYKDAQIKFEWSDGRTLYLHDYATQPVATWTSVGGSLQAAALQLKAECIFVLRDGVSYRLLPPVQSYISDFNSPGYKVKEGTPSLTLRYGRYPFLTPRRAKSINLTAQSQRVQLCAAPHVAAYVLSGRGGVYDIHLTSWALVELSTPQALSQESDASTWNLVCTALEEDITLDRIVIRPGQIRIGSVLVQVPRYEGADTPVENIRIHSRDGSRFDVRLDLGKAYLASVAASPNSSISQLLALLRYSRQRSTVFTPFISVTGIAMADGTVGAIGYDVRADSWTLTTERARRVSSEELVVST
ncbi:hypothetical protein AO262_28285 [Pseudomonas fluorescens ABAC62]|nr:hypothetical protein AO262_28285 [Pseudomonas fluorescens ABAC62]